MQDLDSYFLEMTVGSSLTNNLSIFSWVKDAAQEASVSVDGANTNGNRILSREESRSLPLHLKGEFDAHRAETGGSVHPDTFVRARISNVVTQALAADKDHDGTLSQQEVDTLPPELKREALLRMGRLKPTHRDTTKPTDVITVAREILRTTGRPELGLHETDLLVRTCMERDGRISPEQVETLNELQWNKPVPMDERARNLLWDLTRYTGVTPTIQKHHLVQLEEARKARSLLESPSTNLSQHPVLQRLFGITHADQLYGKLKIEFGNGAYELHATVVSVAPHRLTAAEVTGALREFCVLHEWNNVHVADAVVREPRTEDEEAHFPRTFG